MAELKDREVYEQEIAAALAAVGPGLLRELLRELGDPPDINNVSPEFWETYTRTIDDTLDDHLETVYEAYIAQVLADNAWLGLDTDAAMLAGGEFAAATAATVAEQMTNTTRKRTAAIAARDLSRAELRQRLASLFSPARAVAVAITNVTAAVSGAQNETRRQINAQGIDSIPVWFTREDERVCKICGPLNKRKSDGTTADDQPFWIHPVNGLNYGPPPSPHPRCRCSVDERIGGGVTL